MPNFLNGTKVVTRHYEIKYIRVCAGPQRDQYLHVMLMEARLGRKLREDETVEHSDGNGLNNDPENLLLVTRSENSRLMHERRVRERKERRTRELEETPDAPF